VSTAPRFELFDHARGVNSSSRSRSWPASLVHDHKDVLAVDDVPIAALPVPVSVFVRVPIGIVPIVIGMHRGPVCSLHRSPTATVHYGLSVRV
jgi:hypothetical protein